MKHPFYMQNVLYVETGEAAEFILKEIYKFDLGYIVVTADGKYPSDPSLRNYVWGLIGDNEIQNCVVIGTKHLEDVKHIDNCYCIDQFLTGNPEEDSKTIFKFFLLSPIMPNQKVVKNTHKNLDKMGASTYE